MNIVIVGSGTVGSAICMQLASEGHNITIVDEDARLLGEITDRCDVFGVVGNGAAIATLREAGAERADLLIAVTPKDEINILCCAAARKLGTRHTVARVRNPEYSELMQLLQIRGRNLTPGEEKLARSWLEMGFDDAAITMAYERTCLNTGGLNWAYMNKILQRWHQAGLHTAEAVRGGDRKDQTQSGQRRLDEDERLAIRRMMEGK